MSEVMLFLMYHKLLQLKDQKCEHDMEPGNTFFYMKATFLYLVLKAMMSRRFLLLFVFFFFATQLEGLFFPLQLMGELYKVLFLGFSTTGISKL